MHRRDFAKLLLAAPAWLSTRSLAADPGLEDEADAVLRRELVIDIAASDHFYYLPKQHARPFDPARILQVIGGASLGIGTLTGAMPTFLPEDSLLRQSPTLTPRRTDRPVETPAGSVERMLKEFESIHRAVETHPDKSGIALRADDMTALHRQGRLALVIGLDTGYEIDSNLLVLEALHRLGLRKMALTHEVRPPWAESDTSDGPGGLRPFGREVIAECNRLGIMVDVSHSSDRTFWAALECSKRPIVATHSGARRLCNLARNMDDDMIRAIAKKDGLIGVGGPLNQKTFERLRDAGVYDQLLMISLWFQNEFPDREALANAWYDPAVQKRARAALGYDRTPTTVASSSDMVDYESTLAHLDYITRMIGFDHVGFGTDLEMSDPKYPEIIRGIAGGLIRRKYSEENIRKILGGNFLRFFRANEPRAA